MEEYQGVDMVRGMLAKEKMSPPKKSSPPKKCASRASLCGLCFAIQEVCNSSSFQDIVINRFS